MRPLVALLTVAALFALPTAAPAAAQGWATMVSPRGDSIGQGLHRTFDTAEGDAVLGQMDNAGSDLELWASGGEEGDGYALEFAAPRGQVLVPGVYPNAKRKPFHDDVRPGIDVSGDGRGCNWISGSFEVRELAYDAAGNVERAWVLYEQRCEERGPPLTGEVRIGAPVTAEPRVIPSVARFPAVDAGTPGQTVAVTVSRARVTGVELLGEDFVVRRDGCTGSGASPCVVWVRFMPQAPGTRLGWLRVTDASGRRTDVPLQGFAHGGETSLRVDDLVIGREATFAVHGSSREVSGTVMRPDQSSWNVSFAREDGGPLVPGQTYTSTGHLLQHGGRWCERRSGQFTVHELTTEADALRTAAVSFEYTCDGTTQRGTLRFRAGDTTLRAPWMVASAVPTDLGSAPGAVPPTPVVLVPAPPAPTPSPTPPVTGPVQPATMTLTSEGDFVGRGRAVAFDASRGDEIEARIREGRLDLAVYGADGSEYFLTLGASRGALVPGVYTRALGLARAAGRPVIDLWGNLRACDEPNGSFEVRELRARPDGTIERAWILYEQRCDFSPGRTFGEIRIGAPAVSGPRLTPTLVRWPARDHGGWGRDVPVWVTPTGTISRVEVEGAGFSVVTDNCTGATTRCWVLLRLDPGAPGTWRGALRVTDAAGVASAPLEGFAYGGETKLTLGEHALGPEATFIVRQANHTRVDVEIEGESDWNVQLEAAPGDLLATATHHPDTHGYRTSGVTAGLSVDSGGSSCSDEQGEFTVHELTIVRGELRSLSVSFTRTHCGPDLHGTLRYRHGDTTPLAPWMISTEHVPGLPTAVPDDGSGGDDGDDGDDGDGDDPAPPGDDAPGGDDGSGPAPPGDGTSGAGGGGPVPPVGGPPASPFPGSPPAGEGAGPAPTRRADSPLDTARSRVATSTRRLLAAAKRLRPARVATIRREGRRLAADLRAYRSAVRTHAPATSARRRLLTRLDRQSRAVRSLDRALARYARSGKGRTAIERKLRTLASGVG